MNEIKIVDGFIFAIIDSDLAFDRLKNCECVYRLHSDNTETLLQDENEIIDTLANNDFLGVEIGHKKELKQEFEEGEQNRFRNNDKRNFDEWLDDKINVILE